MLLVFISLQVFSQHKLIAPKENPEMVFIPLGQAGNAYGFSGNPRTYLWADPRINAVVLTHRMVTDSASGGSNSRIAYDVSTESGAPGSWIPDIQVYDPTPVPGSYYYVPARYPQGVIYNPPGNTGPDSAYYTYFAPVLDFSNADWGGYGYGANRLTGTAPPQPTQHNEKTSSDSLYRHIPNAYTITQDGHAWMVDMNYQADSSRYLGQLIINKGTFNADSGDMAYEEWLMTALAEGDSIMDIKIAFSPDGQTGYICLLGDPENNHLPYTCFHPILYITEDGGNTWSAEPVHCQLGGPDGLYEVKYFIPDSMFIIPPMPDRDSLYYGMGYHLDMSVDKLGNAHITGLVAIASSDNFWYPYYYYMGTFHFIYDLQTQAWGAEHLYYNHTFGGDLGGITQYNRPQISSDIIGENLFISWIDTDLEGIEDNISPDIYTMGYDVESGSYTEVANVTAFTQAMWTAYFGSQSHYVFTDTLPGEIRYTIPFVYEALNPQDPLEEVQFWYIDGFYFVEYGIGTPENQGNNQLAVGQNHPNPCLGKTFIPVELTTVSNLKIEVVHASGRTIYHKGLGRYHAGKHQISLNVTGLESGLYFYTVFAGEEKATGKMVVR